MTGSAVIERWEGRTHPQRAAVHHRAATGDIAGLSVADEASVRMTMTAMAAIIAVVVVMQEMPAATSLIWRRLWVTGATPREGEGSGSTTGGSGDCGSGEATTETTSTVPRKEMSISVIVEQTVEVGRGAVAVRGTRRDTTAGEILVPKTRDQVRAADELEERSRRRPRWQRQPAPGCLPGENPTHLLEQRRAERGDIVRRTEERSTAATNAIVKPAASTIDTSMTLLVVVLTEVMVRQATLVAGPTATTLTHGGNAGTTAVRVNTSTRLRLRPTRTHSQRHDYAPTRLIPPRRQSRRAWLGAVPVGETGGGTQRT